MVKTTLYSGTSKNKTVNLPKNFNEKVNLALLAQAIHVLRARSHIGSHVVQTRADVTRVKSKVYSQKGTGKARHGARSAPLFVGGGKAHGPTGEKRTLSLPKKMKAKALNIALTLKTKEKKVVVIDSLSKVKKTSDAVKIIKSIKTGREKSKVTLLLSENNKGVYKFFNNIPNILTMPYRNLNAFKTHFGGILLIDNLALITKKNENTKN